MQEQNYCTDYSLKKINIHYDDCFEYFHIILWPEGIQIFHKLIYDTFQFKISFVILSFICSEKMHLIINFNCEFRVLYTSIRYWKIVIQKVDEYSKIPIIKSIWKILKYLILSNNHRISKRFIYIYQKSAMFIWIFNMFIVFSVYILFTYTFQPSELLNE